jgi:uncharacterized protein (TIGR02246 family)
MANWRAGVLLVAVCAAGLWAQSDDIRVLMNDSEAAWNHGDLETFASYYEDSPSTTFIGKQVTHGGVAAILDRYRRSYPTTEAMGMLHFSEITVRPLGAEYALVTGKFELHRTPAGGGDASGRFTLVMHRSSKGWRIIHDHTS